MTPDAIAQRLRADMAKGRIAPGEDLSQIRLAERFDVSRIPIRDALRILAGEGLVLLEANKGARALELSAEGVREIYDLRILLECDCLRRAGAHLRADDLEDIDRIRRKSDLDATGPDWSAGDWDFHEALYRCARRPRQLALIEALRRVCALHVSAYAALPAKRPKWVRDHRAIVELLRERDIEAAVEALRAHLEGAALHLLAQMRRRRNRRSAAG